MAPRRRSVRAASALLVIASAIALLVADCTSNKASPTTTTTVRSTTTVTPTTAPSGKLTPFDAIEVGNCFDQLPAPAQQPYAVLVIPCAERHLYEVFALATYADPEVPAKGTIYPGDLVVANRADQQCLAGFEEFIGIEWPASDYELQSWWPTEESWTTKNDRHIVCAVTKFDGAHTTGTARGSKK